MHAVNMYVQAVLPKCSQKLFVCVKRITISFSEPTVHVLLSAWIWNLLLGLYLGFDNSSKLNASLSQKVCLSSEIYECLV